MKLRWLQQGHQLFLQYADQIPMCDAEGHIERFDNGPWTDVPIVTVSSAHTNADAAISVQVKKS